MGNSTKVEVRAGGYSAGKQIAPGLRCRERFSFGKCKVQSGEAKERRKKFWALHPLLSGAPRSFEPNDIEAEVMAEAGNS